MAPIVRSSFALRAAQFVRPGTGVVAARRSFGGARVLFAGKESKLQQDDRGEEIEKLKDEQLKDGQWKEGLASDSESIVKADKDELKDSKDTIEELQQETAKLAEKERREGK